MAPGLNLTGVPRTSVQLGGERRRAEATLQTLGHAHGGCRGSMTLIMVVVSHAHRVDDELLAHHAQQTLEGIDRGRDRAPFHPRDPRLAGARAYGERPLREAVSGAQARHELTGIHTRRDITPRGCATRA